MGNENLVNQVLIQFSEQLDLTDNQKSELIELRLDNKPTIQRRSMRPNRRRDSGWRGRSENNPGRNESFSFRRNMVYQDVFEVLNDEQVETLKSLLIERAQNQYEYRLLFHQEMINKTGIVSENIEPIENILNSRAQAMMELKIDRIQESGEIDVDDMQLVRNMMRDGMREMRDILSVNEYDNLQRLMTPCNQRYFSMRR